MKTIIITGANGHLGTIVANHFVRTGYRVIAAVRASGSGRIVFIGARSALQPEQGKNLLAYSLSKSLLFRLAECLNEEARGTNVTASVVVPSTIDSAANRTAMPKADHGAWVNAEDLAGVLEFIVSGRGSALRETVLKVYNKA